MDGVPIAQKVPRIAVYSCLAGIIAAARNTVQLPNPELTKVVFAKPQYIALRPKLRFNA